MKVFFRADKAAPGKRPTFSNRLIASALPWLLALSSTAWALGANDHSTVSVQTVVKGDGLALTFKVSPASGLHINMEGPWTLEIKNPTGLSMAKTTFRKTDMDEKIPGFAVTGAKPEAPHGSFDYQLTAFVCTNDKTQCYRDVLTGKADWSAKK